MKKIYFTDPYSASTTIYYQLVEDDWSESRFRTGYNDTYEMRSEHITKPWFSEDLEDIKELVRKKRRHLIAGKYKELLDAMNYEIEDPIEHDGFCSPF